VFAKANLPLNVSWSMTPAWEYPAPITNVRVTATINNPVFRLSPSRLFESALGAAAAQHGGPARPMIPAHF
jgi:hypothetical protein